MDSNGNDLNLGRRAWMKGAVTLSAGAAGLIPGVAGAANKLSTDTAKIKTGRQGVVAGASNATVETTAGKVRGYTRDGIQTFKGIPYAATTAGAARFLPPSKVPSWTGVRSSMQFGHVCPQGARTGWSNDEEAWLFSWDDGIPGEDCLRVNVWTPAVNDGKKRPVMVWLHGGGFVAGSGQELRSYDGENLSRRGDVVVVTLNHRLGVLGYLNLSEIGGEKYAASANVGMLDLVAALEWVRDNIANFGGDPANVTIFGQSGGGAKVSALMVMPAAKGLFHRAIVQSGSMLRAVSHESSLKLARAVMDNLGLSASQTGELEKVPVERLIAAGAAGLRSLGPQPSPFSAIRIADRAGWGATMDGKVIPQHPFDPSAPQISAGVPMLIGTVLNEFVTGINNPNFDAMTAEEMEKRVTDLHHERAAEVIAAYKRTHPNAKPCDLLSLISAANTRRNAAVQAGRKASLGGAPAWAYLFAWQTPVLDGRPRAFHCCELAFAFDNVARCENMTGNTPEAHELAAKVSEAWIRFARNGDPNHKGLPKWAPYTPDKGTTMVFDNQCEAKSDPDREARRVAVGD